MLNGPFLLVAGAVSSELLYPQNNSLSQHFKSAKINNPKCKNLCKISASELTFSAKNAALHEY